MTKSSNSVTRTELGDSPNDSLFSASFIYSFNKDGDRKFFWDQLISFSSSLGSQPSILMGNLNVIKHVSETNCPSDLKVLLIFKIACIKRVI